ncbi:MAG: T9SS type A sorting domain-containing protein [Bacteroidia bacterium]|nr:T9SS type A sorting domain-containing protein [Bacteroidia bacterium]
MIKYLISIQLLMFFCINASAQLSFSSIPSDLQFIPRNSDNVGVILISGNYNDSTYNQIRVKLSDNSQNMILKDSVINIANNGNFLINLLIAPALKEYNIDIFLKNNTNEEHVKTVKDIVCGDIFIVNGQSNALASLALDDSLTASPGGETQNLLYSNKYCRSIGFNLSTAKYNEASGTPLDKDFTFARPSCIWWEIGFVGAWAMKLQNELANTTNIPSCFVNGAFSGAKIDLLLPSKYPSDSAHLNLNIPYDRLLKKLNYHGLSHFVKGIFWHQGEADALPELNPIAYTEKFENLYNSWKNDYPNAEKIFFFQINTGCSPFESITGLFRDLQVKIAEKHDDIAIMSTVGNTYQDRNNDNCHFSTKGYNNIADKIAPLVKKYIYGFEYADSLILPPRIKKIYISQPDEICLHFNMPINLQLSESIKGFTYYMKDYFYGYNYSALKLTGVRSSGNNVFLQFPENSLIPRKITYLPNNYAYDNLYCGPWILNSKNTLGALSFFEFPVTFLPQTTDITIYPNPAKETVIIGLKEKFSENTITLSDMEGRTIIEFTDKENTEIYIDTKGLLQGVYLIKIKNSSFSVIKKLIINH